MKYIVVTGGVLSGIGKGTIASSTGVILKAFGFRVTSIKIDPYISELHIDKILVTILDIDAGTMSPFEHGEVYVLDDGGEVDLDLGNYERFLGATLTRDNNITTGKIYHQVIEKERKGEYLGKTVQVVPHICDEIQNWIERVAHVSADDKIDPPDVCIIELGGTIGDIESMPFVEAIRQFQFRVGKDNFCSMHVSLVPIIGGSHEQKTKPTQQSIRELRALGISPDVIICRSTETLEKSVKEKVSLFCHVPVENVIGAHDVSNLYRVPLLLHSQGLTDILISKLKLNAPSKGPDLRGWQKIADRYTKLSNTELKGVHIGMVGKYTNLSDAYHSVISALQHASLKIEERLIIDWIEATSLEISTKESHPEMYEKAWETLRKVDGILVPGGFGDRGVEGKISAINYARTNNIPFLGICLGMQLAVIEVCRNVMGLKNANSTEFNEAADPKAVIFMPDVSRTYMGGTMRLGKRISRFRNRESVAYKLYGNVDNIDERHRHRYEINPDLVPKIEKESNLRFVAQDETGKRMEIVELLNHPFFIACQYHPEFKSRPLKASPLFVGLMLASAKKLNEWFEKKKGKSPIRGSTDSPFALGNSQDEIAKNLFGSPKDERQ